jgi:regulator of nucleoside diphosphate kinase
MSNQPIPVVTELDAARIRELGARLPDRGEGESAFSILLEMVEQEADIVPAAHVKPDVVTINSTVSFRDELSGSVHQVTVVYPQDVAVANRRISVLSPVGRALLGQRVGWIARVALPDGSTRELRVLELHYQPEAAGDFAR